MIRGDRLHGASETISIFRLSDTPSYWGLKCFWCMAILAILVYAVFVVFWCFFISLIPVGIVDSIHAMRDSSFAELTPWTYPENEIPIWLRAQEHHKYPFRRGELRTYFYDVQFMQILPDGQDWPLIVERESNFDLRRWHALFVPLLLMMAIVILLTVSHRWLRHRPDSSPQKN